MGTVLVDCDNTNFYVGIHGLPFIPYNGVGQVPGGAGQAGFCPHDVRNPYEGSTTASNCSSKKEAENIDRCYFSGCGIGHMLLFTRSVVGSPAPIVNRERHTKLGADSYKQVLVSHALNISMQYHGDEAPLYRTTAESLRAVYWDWAKTPSLPEAVTLETVTVNSPNGSVTIRNPFHSYYFQEYPFAFPHMNSGTLSTQKHTTRCPTMDLMDNITTVNDGLLISNLKGQVVGFGHLL